MKNMSLKAQLFSAFTVMGLLILAIGAFATFSSGQIASAALHLGTETAIRAEASEEAKLLAGKVVTSIEDHAQSLDRQDLEAMSVTLTEIHEALNKMDVEEHEEGTSDEHSDRESELKQQLTVALQKASDAEQFAKSFVDALANRGAIETDKTFKQGLDKYLNVTSALLEKATINQQWAITSAVEDLRANAINSRILLSAFQIEKSYQEIKHELEKLLSLQQKTLSTLPKHVIGNSEIERVFDEYQRASNQRVEAFQQQAKAEGDLRTQLTTIAAQLQAEVFQINHSARIELEEDTKELEESVSFAKYSMMLAVAVGLGLSALFSGYLLNTVTKPLNRCVDVANKIAEGNLDISIGETNLSETGRLLSAMKSMSNSLRGILSTIHGTTHNLSSGNRQQKETNQHMASSALDQAESISSVTKALADNALSLKKSADDASTVKNIALEANQRANEGHRRMQTMLEAMQEIHESSDKIGDIIGTINEIAFQTNLLALNAAVEAARAGDHGRGFAVVASEVRSLALKSGEAAEGTRKLLEASALKAQNGQEAANQTAESLDAIVESISQVSDYVDRISSSSLTQAEAVDRMSESLGRINTHTQQNAQISEESAKSSDRLVELTTELEQQLSFFSVKDAISSPQSNRPVLSSRTNREPASG